MASLAASPQCLSAVDGSADADAHSRIHASANPLANTRSPCRRRVLSATKTCTPLETSKPRIPSSLPFTAGHTTCSSLIGQLPCFLCLLDCCQLRCIRAIEWPEARLSLGTSDLPSAMHPAESFASSRCANWNIAGKCRQIRAPEGQRPLPRRYRPVRTPEGTGLYEFPTANLHTRHQTQGTTAGVGWVFACTLQRTVFSLRRLFHIFVG